MASKTIFDTDFQFNNLNLSKIIFSDNSEQTTAYLGNSPAPRQIIYPITTSTILYCNNGLTAVTTSNFQIVNLYTVFVGALYFQNPNNENINSTELVFNNTYSGNLEITLLNDVALHPIITSSSFAYFIQNSTGILIYGTLQLNNSGSLVAYFNNVNIIQLETYTLNFFTFQYA